MNGTQIPSSSWQYAVLRVSLWPGKDCCPPGPIRDRELKALAVGKASSREQSFLETLALVRHPGFQQYLCLVKDLNCSLSFPTKGEHCCQLVFGRRPAVKVCQ